MNPEQWLTYIAGLIPKKPISGSGTWTLIWRNNDVLLVPTREAGPVDIRFGTITANEVLNGLTTPKWNEIKTKLSLFLHQKGLL